MSTKPLMLESETVKLGTDPYEEIVRLRNEVTDLRTQLAAAEEEARRAKGMAFLATANLRKQLSPLYNALRQVFGELDAISPADSGAAASPPANSKWDAVKLRLAPRQREAVDILMVQGSMKRTQLATAMRMDRSNCTKNVVGVLIRQGLLIDDNGDLSLKQL